MLRILRYTGLVVVSLFLTTILGVVFSFIGHFSTFGGNAEQQWLDQCVKHMYLLRATCDDPDLQVILDYTVRRYNRIGPFDVAVTCLWQMPFQQEVIGINTPLVPGISVDLELLNMSIHAGTIVLVHEAAHDYWPYIHPLVDTLTNKIDRL